MKGGVSEETFTLFLRHMYGCKLEVAAITEVLTLAELHSITLQFKQLKLGEEMRNRTRNLLNTEAGGPCSPCHLVEVTKLLTRHQMEELLPLVEKKLKEIHVGEADLAGLVVIVNKGGAQAKVSCSWPMICYAYFKFII